MIKRIKVLLLASASSAHTIKWANGLQSRECEVTILSLNSYFDLYQYSQGIRIESIDIPRNVLSSKFGSIEKLVYLKALPKLKRLLLQIQPNILHAHYASSYGLLGALSGYHPYLISIWGADIFTFPQNSIFHRYLLKFILKRGDSILSTSNFMRSEIKKFTKKKIQVTPFGIDVKKFRPIEVDSIFSKGNIVIGTIKGLEEQYGIEYLIKAFKKLSDKYFNLPLKLLIVGGGSLEYNLKQLAEDLGLNDNVRFTGYVQYDSIEKYHNMLDVYVALSIIDDESFGVAILEACACAKPVVVSRVGGLPEIVEENVTGFIVPPRNIQMAADAIEKLLLDKELRNKMGSEGMRLVQRYYNFETNLNQMLDIYNSIQNTIDSEV